MNIQRFFLSASKLTPKEYYNMTKAKKLYVKEHNKCAVCGTEKHLEVHHIIPVHIDPTQSADPSNFITLCDPNNKGCHYKFGHFENFRTKWNPAIEDFAEEARDMLEYGYDKFQFIVSNAN